MQTGLPRQLLCSIGFKKESKEILSWGEEEVRTAQFVKSNS